MNTIREKILAFVRDEEGLTMTEYAVAGALVTVGAVIAFTNLGTAISGVIQSIADTINGA
jgi:pilus assembly protein Flp/PilA